MYLDRVLLRFLELLLWALGRDRAARRPSSQCSQAFRCALPQRNRLVGRLAHLFGVSEVFDRAAQLAE